MILAGDIGGTKAQLALFEPEAGPRRPALEQRLPTRGSPSLEAVLKRFLADTGARPSRAVFGVAGPVAENRCIATNLPWHVDGASLSAEIGAPVTLLNDLEATAWGLETLGESDLSTLQPGTSRAGHRVLIAAGTGLGESLLPWDGTTWRPMASEGGHTDFGPRDALEDELLAWLRARYGRVSYERVLSGPGLADLYRFHRDTRRGEETAEAAAFFDAAADPAAAVHDLWQQGGDRARQTMRRFASIYGAEAGNLALKGLALGGAYVGGGIAPRVLAALTDGTFVRGFTAKGRLSPVVQFMPVHVVLDPKTAVWGAALHAQRSSTPDA